MSRIKKFAKEGSNWDPPDHAAKALPFALQNLYVEKLTQVGLLYGIPSGIHMVYGECTCDKIADL